MIRLKRFDITSYQKLREWYLKSLLSSNAIAFDTCDVLFESEQFGVEMFVGRTETTLQWFNRDLTKYPLLARLKQFLFIGKDTVNKENLRLLLVGPEPEDIPQSFGGCGQFQSMRAVFDEKIILPIGMIKRKPSKVSQETKNTENETWKICTEIFKYEQMRKGNTIHPQGPAYWLQEQLDVRICPFCNRIYTTTLSDGGIRPAFDHFYPKSVYPYLAVSLFNLIPICDICNKSKSNKIVPLIYPYDEAFEQHLNKGTLAHTSFRVVPTGNDPWTVFRGQSDAFTLQLQPADDNGEPLGGYDTLSSVNSSLNQRFPANLDERFPVALDGTTTSVASLYWARVKSSIKILKLEDLYNANPHKYEIMHLLQNRYYYNHVAIEAILQVLLSSGLNKTGKALLFEAQNILYFADLDPNDWGLRPLNKLKADILKQMNMLEALAFQDAASSRKDKRHG